MPLGAKLGLGPGQIVFHGDPDPPKKGAQPPPNFQPISIVGHNRHGPKIGGRPSQLLLNTCSVFV